MYNYGEHEAFCCKYSKKGLPVDPGAFKDLNNVQISLGP